MEKTFLAAIKHNPEIKRSNRNLNQTILLITHDGKIALESDRIFVIEDGKIVRDHLERQR